MKRSKRGGSVDGGPVISAEQAKALELLAAGKNVGECAEGAGVNRATIYRWLRGDPHFLAAWNAWRRTQVKMARSRLLGLTSLAIGAVESSLEKGDGKLAASLLGKMGLLTPEPFGPEEPEAVRRDLECDVLEQRGKVFEREQAMFIESTGYDLGTEFSEKENSIEGKPPGKEDEGE